MAVAASKSSGPSSDDYVLWHMCTEDLLQQFFVNVRDLWDVNL